MEYIISILFDKFSLYPAQYNSGRLMMTVIIVDVTCQLYI